MRGGRYDTVRRSIPATGNCSLRITSHCTLHTCDIYSGWSEFWMSYLPRRNGSQGDTPMRRISTALLTLVCVLSSLVTALAQSASTIPSVPVPRLIQITGVFQPVDGQPPSAVEIVTLSVYADADGGLPVWQERQTVAVEKTTGRFTLLLGASNPAGIPAQVFASGDAQWMSLLFERAGEREQPRVRIASVPYALKASDAETLGGLPASAYLRAPTTLMEGGSAKTATATSATLTAADAPSLAAVLPGTT